MSEFSIEEKANAYDIALEKAKILLSKCKRVSDKASMIYRAEDIESMFPELKESEDERIRKVIIKHFKEIANKNEQSWKNLDIPYILAWLEKQGKETISQSYLAPKSASQAIKEIVVDNANKVELKFQEGDFIKHNKSDIIYKVFSIDNNSYFLKNIETDEIAGEFECFNLEQNFHFWTIKDAKDGDVLWHSDSASNGIFIFKEIRHDGKVLCYCDYDSEDHFCLGEHHTCCWINDKYIKPATKEQRYLLFKKMKEASYEWDVDKKELKKIEQKPVEETSCDKCKNVQPSHSCQDIAELGRCYLEHEKQGEQKPTWSEEDELMLKDAIEFIETGWSDKGKSHLIYWLKSIKDRIK